MLNLVIIGIGNTLRQDDGVGWLAAERLMEEMDGRADVIACHQLQPEMAERLSRADRVIFIDARVNAAPGEVRCDPVQPGDEAWGALVHQMNPGSILTCARDLFGRAPQAWAVSVGGKNFGLGEGLSEPVHRGLDEALTLIRRMAAEDGDA